MNSGQRERVERRLAAVLAADVAGYSRLMGADEEGTLEPLKALRYELVDPKIAEHHGRIVKTTGDGMLVEFASVVDAVRCAVGMQQTIAERNTGIAADTRIELRIGINLGDVIVESDDLYGDGVNIAARIEALADPGGVFVSNTVYDQERDRLPFVFEDLGEQQVKNIARPVRVFRAQLSTTKAAAATPTLALPDKPSIAVLPFQNITGDAEQEYFVDGMVEEITTAISRLPWLFVIARNSSFTYKGKAVDVKQVARELGVRYLLEGSVRKAGNRVRIAGQLIDTSTGAHIWADRFDGTLDDIFELQDQVAASVVGAIEPRLRHSEIERARRKPTESLDAYDLYLRALAQFHKFTAESCSEAIRLARQALEIDPTYAPPGALIGVAYAWQIAQGWTRPDEARVVEIAGLAKRAVQYGKEDPDALWMAANVIAFTGEVQTAANVIDRALSLNPNSAHGWMIRGWIHTFLNQPKPASDALERAMRLSPLDPLGYQFAWGLGLAAFEEGQYEEAIQWADLSLREEPTALPALRVKVAASSLLNKPAEAQQALRRMLELHSGLTVANYTAYALRFMAPEVVAAVADGLRQAGLPEG
jgi:adenylate cyclase